METWRPKGWKNPYHIAVVIGTNENADDTAFSAYEKGADNILKALKKQGMPISHIERWHDIKTMMEKFNVRPAIGDAIGYIVFIPDKGGKE